jgi:hypothetical protein
MWVVKVEVKVVTPQATLPTKLLIHLPTLPFHLDLQSDSSEPSFTLTAAIHRLRLIQGVAIVHPPPLLSPCEPVHLLPLCP